MSTRYYPSWPRVMGNRRQCWDTPWGHAYGWTPPPPDPPLTKVKTWSLPEGTEVLVLWFGGNGVCEYRLERRDGWVGIGPQEEPPGSPWWRVLDFSPYVVAAVWVA